LFLQPFAGVLYKAEPLLRGCSEQYVPALSNKRHPYRVTLKGDNAVQMTNKRCPKDSAKSVLLIVEKYLLSVTRLHTTRRD
jgi:hypothetical protein